METWGAVPERTMIDAGAASLGALVYGPSAAPPVVLLHGWADSAWSMDCVAAPLADRYRVISLDLRGHGHSDRGPYNMLNLIGDLRGAIESLDLDRPAIIGHSLGGQISAQFCGLFPEVPRALALVEGVGPPRHRLAGQDPDTLERERSRYQVERTRQPARSRTLPDLATAEARLQEAHPLLDRARVTLLARENTVFGPDGQRRWRFDPASRDWFNGHGEETAAQRWRGTRCPTLVVAGGDAYDRYWRHITDDPADFPAPLQGEDLADRLANFADVRYAEIPGAGHMVPYDRPDELNAVLATFLAEVDG